MAREANIQQAREFEQIAVSLLARQDFNLRPAEGRDRGLDFFASFGGKAVAVEVKLYPTFRIAWNVVRRSFQTLQRAMAANNISVGILVTNARIPSALKHEALLESIIIVDYDFLGNIAAPDPEISARLREIFHQSFVYRTESLDEYVPQPPGALGLLFRSIPPGKAAPPPAPTPGADLCNALKQTETLKENEDASAVVLANLFADACENALRYIFKDDLTAWDRETKTQGNLHRFDLSARIASDNDFWNALVRDHRTRYLIFEFKNYSKKLHQIPIYTTEKYLFPVAMRSTAVIISRHGLDDNAYRVTEGALRESGKIILSLDIADVCDMLHKKDKGEDPTAVIADKLDDLMRHLER